MNKKMRTVLLALSIGMGVSVAQAGYVDMRELCQSWQDACDNGESFACERVIRNCR